MGDVNGMIDALWAVADPAAALTCHASGGSLYFRAPVSASELLTTALSQQLGLSFGALYADGAQAARRCASASAEDPAAVAAEIEAAAQTNALGLVPGAAKRGAVTQSRTLQDFWGAAPKKKAKTAAPCPPATAAPRRRTVAERAAKRAQGDSAGGRLAGRDGAAEVAAAAEEVGDAGCEL